MALLGKTLGLGLFVFLFPRLLTRRAHFEKNCKCCVVSFFVGFGPRLFGCDEGALAEIKVCVHPEVTGVFCEHKLIVKSEAIDGCRWCDDFGELFASHVSGHINRRRKIRTVENVVYLRRQAAFLRRSQHGAQDALAEMLYVHPLERRDVAEINYVVRRDRARGDVFVGDTRRGPTVGVDDDERVLGSARAERGGCDEKERDKRAHEGVAFGGCLVKCRMTNWVTCHDAS